MKKLYITHKLEVYDDAFHWLKIITSIPDIGEIYHLDYSQNMTKINLSVNLCILVRNNSLFIVLLNIYQILKDTFIIFQM